MTTQTRIEIGRQRRLSKKRKAVVTLFAVALVLTGIGLATYTAWQVWGSDASYQAAAEETVEELTQEWSEPTPEPPVVPEPQPEPAHAHDNAPAQPLSASVSDEATEADTEPAVESLPPAQAPAATAAASGEVWATLSVPRWKTELPIATGTHEAVIDEGIIGYYDATQLPGETGNFGITAHRTTHGAPFRDLHELEDGDELIVKTEEGSYVYEVTGSEITDPYDTGVLLPIPHDWYSPADQVDGSRITLIACHPLYSVEERIIVYGELVHFTPAS